MDELVGDVLRQQVRAVVCEGPIPSPLPIRALEHADAVSATPEGLQMLPPRISSLLLCSSNEDSGTALGSGGADSLGGVL